MYGIVDYPTSRSFSAPLFVDVRSEHEYSREKIPGAINLPVLLDDEHEQVGKLYKAKQYDVAKNYGVTCISRRLPQLFEQLQEWSHHHQVILYCKGGGYRSSSLFALCRALDVKVLKLDQGYKGFRKYIVQALETLPAQFEFVNLNGLTGVGKTEILASLIERGAQVLDLEACANHRGSHFGQVGLATQPSQKDFEACIFDKLDRFCPGPVFIECESKRIGRCLIPKALYQAYQTTNHQVYIGDSLTNRVERIYREYIDERNDGLANQLNNAIEALSPYVSKARLKAYHQAVAQENYQWLIGDLIERHYDPHYAKAKRQFELSFDQESSAKICDQLYRYYIC